MRARYERWMDWVLGQVVCIIFLLHEEADFMVEKSRTDRTENLRARVNRHDSD